MLVKLKVVRGRTQQRVIELRAAETIVGRQTGCGLKIPAADVSRRHCRLLFQDGLLTVEDLNSVNGTFLNGVPVTSRRLARPGDELQIGPLTFLIDYPLHEAPRDKIFQKPQPSAEPGPFDNLGQVDEEPGLGEFEILEDADEALDVLVADGDSDTVEGAPDDEPVVLEVDEDEEESPQPPPRGPRRPRGS